MSRLHALPSQTVGPFYHFSLTVNPALGCMTSGGAKGEHIRVRFRMLDGDGAPIPDGFIELWQADAAGKYHHPADTQKMQPDPAFCGFGRLATDRDGYCTFDTIRPGRTPDGLGGCQASHINVTVFARGLLSQLMTRLYFEGDPALAEDSVWNTVPEERRGTLLARRNSEGVWCFEIHLQGENETVFFQL
jgi:protocatechuate 3,4-dioxygenase alpha subunit